MTITRKTMMDRAVSGTIIAMVLLSLALLLYLTYGAAVNEFNWSVRARELSEQSQRISITTDLTPPPAAIYRSIYPYSWTLLAAAFLWGLWILRKPSCSLLSLVLYVGVFLNLASLWLLFTLLAFYFENQRFYW